MPTHQWMSHPATRLPAPPPSRHPTTGPWHRLLPADGPSPLLCSVPCRLGAVLSPNCALPPPVLPVPQGLEGAQASGCARGTARGGAREGTGHTHTPGSQTCRAWGKGQGLWQARGPYAGVPSDTPGSLKGSRMAQKSVGHQRCHGAAQGPGLRSLCTCGCARFGLGFLEKAEHPRICHLRAVQALCAVSGRLTPGAVGPTSLSIHRCGRKSGRMVLLFADPGALNVLSKQ